MMVRGVKKHSFCGPVDLVKRSVRRLRTLHVNRKVSKLRKSLYNKDSNKYSRKVFNN